MVEEPFLHRHVPYPALVIANWGGLGAPAHQRFAPKAFHIAGS
jgi:hypothetical protein